jgi:hypothetical protein
MAGGDDTRRSCHTRRKSAGFESLTARSPVLWELDDHTAAKHRVLRGYLDGWIPVMANRAAHRIGQPRLLLADGFAGPGRYAAGERGSPLLMLDALLLP